jgi:hypothetical protein
MGQDGEYHADSPRPADRVAAQEALLKLLAQHASS